uniref:Uncharacterized protein n=1 Tax=Trypanosoma congolense (strain IL3000) TaxID=1068625 RepID=G0UTM6_TRYCI|nr:hypothetical protein, unlikely [Trypanosoma congolense IL3000]
MYYCVFKKKYKKKKIRNILKTREGCDHATVNSRSYTIMHFLFFFFLQTCMPSILGFWSLITTSCRYEDFGSLSCFAVVMGSPLIFPAPFPPLFSLRLAPFLVPV